jgi:cobalamin biosynthesis protein CbiG
VRAAQGAAEVVDDRGRYTIVEKTGHAGDLVEELDPRGGDG